MRYHLLLQRYASATKRNFSHVRPEAARRPALVRCLVQPLRIPASKPGGSFAFLTDHETGRLFSSSSVMPLVESNEGDQRIQFQDLDLHPDSLRAVTKQGLMTMTEIQEKTFEPIVQGKDVLGRARTGTGKTLSFLLPGLERIVRNQPVMTGQIQMLILSPTRELAAQIASHAKWLVAAHSSSNKITSHVVYGGSSKQQDILRFESNIPSVLVATPGRLKDHLLSTTIHGRPFVDALQQLQVLVLDETDRLLDLGFRQEIQDILDFLPTKRQTLLFSATLPPTVRSILQLATKSDYVTVDCIQDQDPTTHTNLHTEQSHVIVPADRFLTGTVETLLSIMDQPDHKTMVFFPMTSMVELYSTLLSFRLGRRNILELHGKLRQSTRSQISSRFRQKPKGVTLLTTDVSARGVDYPDVTHVVQVGAADSRETYIHRLGRTGRAGKQGKGLLILPEIESYFLNELKGLDVALDPNIQAQLVSEPSKSVMDELGPIAAEARAGRDPKLLRAATDTYQAMVSYYFQRASQRRGSELDIVTTINRMVEDIGMRELPAISSSRAKRFGCDRVPGLNIRQEWDDRSVGKWSKGRGLQSGPSQSESSENSIRDRFQRRSYDDDDEDDDDDYNRSASPRYSRDREVKGYSDRRRSASSESTRSRPESRMKTTQRNKDKKGQSHIARVATATRGIRSKKKDSFKRFDSH